MSLGGDIAWALPRLRAEAESMMTDAVIVERQTGTTPDPETLEDVATWATVHEGRARIQRTAQVSPSEQVVGEVEFGINAVIVQLPLGATGIKKGHRVTVTAAGPLSDPDLVGLRATVQANLTKTHPTKRTLVCEEVS